MSDATKARPVRPHRKKWGWHPETFVCSRRGHVTPAALVRRLRPEDAGLGVDLPDGRRMARCTRCDVWIATTAPKTPVRETLPPLHRGTLGVLLGTSVAYCVVEGVEAGGLGRERRWAEYLTAAATAGFL